VFTARYGLIPYMKHITFRLLKVKIPLFGCPHATTGKAGGQISQALSAVLQTVPRLVSCDAVSFGRVGSDVSKDASVSVFRVKPSCATTFRDDGKQTTRPSVARRSTAPGPRQWHADVVACRVPQ
jgi:hypothetical protein